MAVTAKTSRWMHSSILMLLLLVLGIFAVYWQIFDHPLLMDDRFVIANNESIRDLDNVPDFFVNSWQLTQLYRPLAQTSLSLDYFFWQENIVGYRLSSCLWHILASFCLFLAVRKCFPGSRVPFYATCLYAFHPIHSEVVNFASMRAESMCAAFTFLAFFCYLHGSRVSTFASALLFLLACLSKETAAALFIFVVVYEWALSSRPVAFPKITLLGGVLLGYLLLRSWAIGGFSESHHAFAGESFTTRLLTMSWAFAQYWRLCIWPTGLGRDYQLNDFPVVSSLWQVPALIGVTSLLVYFLVMGKSYQARERVVLGSLAWFGIFLLPVANIIPTAVVMGERLLTLPLAGFAILVAYLLQRWIPKRALFVLILLLLAYGAGSLWRSSFHHAPLTLYERILSLSPRSYIAHMRLGRFYLQQGESQQALEHYRQAVTLRSYPQNAPMAPLNCGQIYLRHGELDKAAKYLQLAVARIEQHQLSRKEYQQAYWQLARLYFRFENWPQAAEVLEQLLASLEIAKAEYRHYLAMSYAYQQKYQQAISEYQRLLESHPEGKYHYNLALIYLELKQLAKAREHLQQAEQKNVEVPQVVWKRWQQAATESDN